MRWGMLLLAALAPGCGDDGAGGVAACVLGADELTVEDHRLVGATLELDVRYTGGCEDHDFEVWWAGTTGTSDPPIVPLELLHYAHGDTCEAIVSETVVIDLRALHSVPGGTMHINVVMGERGSVGLLTTFYTVPDPVPEPGADAIPIEAECATI